VALIPAHLLDPSAAPEGVDIKVQQSLLRHADIGTTLNTYTIAVPEDMRIANDNVVEMVLRKKAASA
jgi:site-specific recombinase XerD